MTSLFGVEVTKGGDSTPTEWQVGAVAMATCDRARSKVEGSSTPDAVGEVASEGGVVLEELVTVIFIVHI